MTDKQKIARLVAALRPFAEMRKAAKGRMSSVGIGLLNPDAEIERLARKLHDAVFIPSHWDEQGAVARADYRRIARAAWAKGARP